MKSALRLIIMSVILPYSFSTLGNGHDEVIKRDIEKVDALRFQLGSARRQKGALQNIYPKLKEVSVELKKLAPSFHQMVIDDLEKEKPMHGAQLTLLHKIVGLFVELDYGLLKLTTSRENLVLKTLASADRYENFSVIYFPYYRQKKFRNLVNAEDSSYGVERKELKRQLRDLVKKENVKEALSLLDDIYYRVNQGMLNRSDAYVSDVLGHPAIKIIKDKKLWRKWRKLIFGQTLSDFGTRVRSNIIHQISGAFGNGMGSIRWRKGWLFEDETIRQEIFAQLKPLDVITEKVSFTPTDFFIPGHFGHNAIWLGSEFQLKELGIWDNPLIKPHQAEIRAGKSIIETDRSGTHFKSLRDFMNVDEFGLLRFRRNVLEPAADLDKTLKIYQVALAQLGKTYDFNFDVETTDKLVCSELLYQSFGNINWPTEDYLGRTTISPDNVVSLALFDNAPIDLVYFVKGTKEGDVIYKNTDDLANDIGFVKVDGLYKQPYKVCKTERVKRPGSRGSDEMTKRVCEEFLRDLQYTGHAPLPDLAISL